MDPKYPGQKPTYSKTDEARWMNRRVVMTVMDDQGRTVSAAGVGEAIRAMEPQASGRHDGLLQRSAEASGQAGRHRQDVEGLGGSERRSAPRAGCPEAGPAGARIEGEPAAAQPPTAAEVAQATSRKRSPEIKKKEPKFQLLGVNVGDGFERQHLTATGKGRFFGLFAEHYAFQAQGEYFYYKDQKEGQVDLGLVDRIGRFQAGLFASFKHVALSGNQNGGNAGPGRVDYRLLSSNGARSGAYGTNAFMNNAMINSVAAVLANGITSPDLMDQRFLRVVNQAGASFSFGLWGNNYIEGNVGYLKSVMYGDRVGGTVRFVFPLNHKIALTLEGGLNETLLGSGNSGFARAGLRFGNAVRPKDFCRRHRSSAGGRAANTVRDHQPDRAHRAYGSGGQRGSQSDRRSGGHHYS